MKYLKILALLLCCQTLLAQTGQKPAEEKTEEQKKKEAWENFQKVIEHRIHNDWAWLERYADENQKLAAPVSGERRIVFLGNSITEGWINTDPDFFKGKNYINRGIGGQTTPQMLVRFREDVINLKPEVVVILAGINDIAENTGPSKIENVAGNIFSMAELARASHIKVILSSVLPALAFPWHPGINPVPGIIQLNQLLKDYAEKNRLIYIDYYSATINDDKGFKKELTVDGVHPNMAGYKVMEPMAEKAITEALTRK
jgi:lysophospholipase L1-like esterase